MRTIVFKRNQKGVSPIIATLLLIVIAVAAAVVTYAFVTGFIGGATKTSTVPGSMSVPSFSITGAQTVTCYVENTGTKILTLNANSAYIDGLAATVNTPVMPVQLGIGATQTLTLTSIGAAINDGSAHSLKIVAADGTTVAISIVTPS